MATYSWDEPRCFIENTEDQGLHVNEETIHLLQQVMVPVDVVAIVGLYRTGKSYLLNRLAGRNTGFDIGSTIQAKTKGIWAWCRPHPQKQNTCLLLLDTEGLGDPEKGDKDHDVKIFALAVLLSNTLVYNSKGTIDNDALEKLHFVTDISEHVKVKSNSDDDDDREFDGYFPRFIWAVRDFHLKLELNGRPCTSDEYMENALEIKPGTNRKVFEYNLPRRSLKNYFPSRKCFVFPQPLNDMKLMSKLDSLAVSDLRVDFLDTTQKFLEYLKTKSQPKSIRGASVTGRGLANLCEIYVKAIKEGAVPCIENAVDAMARAENTKAAEDALQFYTAEMKKINLPTETLEQLSRHHQKCEEEAISVFIKASIFDNEQKYQKQMAESIIAEYEKVLLENEVASVSKCQAILHQLYAPITANVKSGVYLKPGGYPVYKKAMNDMIKKYDATQGKGIKAAEVMKSFMTEKASEEKYIMDADKKLSEEEKKIAEEKRKADQAKREKAAADAELKKSNQKIADMQKSHEENLKQLEKKQAEQAATLQKQFDEQMEKKMNETRELMKKGFEEDAQALREQIEALKSAQVTVHENIVPIPCVIM